MADMVYPSWKQSLARSLHTNRSKPYAKYFHVANVDALGNAQSRTMVFRGFAPNSLVLFAITDIRSDKIAQWQAHPYAQISWYFTQSREQYRITSELVLLGEDFAFGQNAAQLACLEKERKQVWHNLSPASQSQFEWPTPKQNVDDLDVNEQKLVGALSSESISESVHKNFVLVCFIPTAVDYLNLKEKPQRRELSQLVDNEWETQTVNP